MQRMAHGPLAKGTHGRVSLGLLTLRLGLRRHSWWNVQGHLSFCVGVVLDNAAGAIGNFK